MNFGEIIPGRVSIVVAAYNCAATIGAAIESCLAQTYRNVEIIVVNDGSTDRTAEVLQSFDSKIVVVNKRNGGLASARNAGARAATGEYVAWMDADDLMESDRIMLQIEVLKSDSGIELVSSDFSSFVDVNADLDASYVDKYYSGVVHLGGLARIYPQSHEMIVAGRSVTVRTGRVYIALLYGNFVHPPTVMVRLDLFKRIGFFDETLRYTSDCDFIIRAARIARFAYIDKPLLRYRLGNTQMSHNAADGKILLETIDILRKIQHDDPETFLHQQQLFRRRFAELNISAADLIGPSNRHMALHLLIRGVRHEFLFGAVAHAFARIVVPRIAVRTAKMAWRFLKFGAN